MNRALRIKFSRRGIYNALLMIAMTIIIGGNTSIYDYEAYKTSYLNIIKPKFERGYLWLEDLCSNVITFDAFKILVCCFSLYVIYKFAKKRNANTIVVLLLYFLYPFPQDGALIRNTIAKSICFIGFYVLLSKRRYNKLLSFLLIALASQFHSISIVYMIPVIAWIIYEGNKLQRRKIIKYLITVIAIFAIITSLYRPLLNYLISTISLVSFFAGAKEVYLNIAGRYGFLVYTCIQLLSLYILYLSWLQLKETDNKDINIQETSKLVLFLMVICSSLLFMIPLYKTNSNYFRVFMNIIPLVYIGVISTLKLTKEIKSKRRYAIILLLIIEMGICLAITGNFKIIFMYKQSNWILN